MRPWVVCVCVGVCVCVRGGGRRFLNFASAPGRASASRRVVGFLLCDPFSCPPASAHPDPPAPSDPVSFPRPVRRWAFACRYKQAELVHARFAMLGVAGVLFPEALKGLGLGGPAAQASRARALRFCTTLAEERDRARGMGGNMRTLPAMRGGVASHGLAQCAHSAATDRKSVV